MCRAGRRNRRRTGLFIKRKKEAVTASFFNARDRNRTGTVSPQQDFKSCASASSATRASIFYTYIKKFSLHNHNENGQRWIRTTEAICSRFTVCPLWPLGNLPIYQSLIVLTNIDYSITPCCVQGVFMHFLHFLFCHFLFFRILSLQNDSCMLWQCNIQSSIDDVIADRRNGVSIFTGKKYLF